MLIFSISHWKLFFKKDFEFWFRYFYQMKHYYLITEFEATINDTKLEHLVNRCIIQETVHFLFSSGHYWYQKRQQ